MTLDLNTNHDMICFVILILFLSLSFPPFLPFLDLISCQTIPTTSRPSNSLQLFQLHVCHEQEVTLECPINSVINIVIATYGAAAIDSKEEKMCSSPGSFFPLPLDLENLFQLLQLFPLMKIYREIEQYFYCFLGAERKVICSVSLTFPLLSIFILSSSVFSDISGPVSMSNIASTK